MENESKQPHTSSLPQYHSEAGYGARRGRQILDRRKEVEKELVELIKKIGSSFSVQDVKDAVYNEESGKDFNDLVAKFNRGQDLDELNKDLQTVSTAWNYFPHKVIGGISPAEKLLEHHKNPHK